jgi:2-keto-4-pentenoate hydratase/2-oxohepta-3-ene-1,7-dioic acid hydratase in catechol pathway
MRIARTVIAGSLAHGDLDDGWFHVLAGDIYESPVRTGERHRADDLELLSPIEPGRILLILGGFLQEGAKLLPGTVPQFAVKTVSSVSGNGGCIAVPPFVTTPLWIEVELAAVIGHTLHRADRATAGAGIWGYTCFNDASAPEFIYDLNTGKSVERPDYFLSKSIETFASMGPCVRTDLDEAEVVDGLRLTTRVNGELRAEGTTRLAKFAPSEIVSYLSRQMTLRRGDVIALGTPQPALAAPGDEVELAVEGIGSFRNQLVAAGPESAVQWR